MALSGTLKKKKDSPNKRTSTKVSHFYSICVSQKQCIEFRRKISFVYLNLFAVRVERLRFMLQMVANIIRIHNALIKTMMLHKYLWIFQVFQNHGKRLNSHHLQQLLRLLLYQQTSNEQNPNAIRYNEWQPWYGSTKR